MDFVERLTGNMWQGVTPASLLKFSNLDARVQRHLQQVYLTLTLAVAVAAAGCAADIAYHVSGLLTYLCAFGCLVGLSLTNSTPQTLNKRYALLAGFSFCQGASLGPLVSLAVALHPGLLLTAFMATTAIFLSFTLAALLTTRRSFLFLGGYLASAISAMFVLRLGGWLFGARAMTFNAELYLGLLVFAAYILVDTQIIVEKAHAGYQDHVKHALDLLVDLIAVFVRVLVVLLKNAEKRKEDEKRKRR